MGKKRDIKKMLIKRLREMEGDVKVKLALDLTDTVRRIYRDGQRARRAA